MPLVSSSTIYAFTPYPSLVLLYPPRILDSSIAHLLVPKLVKTGYPPISDGIPLDPL
jgi:hypothetical protein